MVRCLYARHWYAGKCPAQPCITGLQTRGWSRRLDGDYWVRLQVAWNALLAAVDFFRASFTDGLSAAVRILFAPLPSPSSRNPWSMYIALRRARCHPIKNPKHRCTPPPPNIPFVLQVWFTWTFEIGTLATLLALTQHGERVTFAWRFLAGFSVCTPPLANRLLGPCSSSALQGYLAHKKQAPPRTLQ